MSHASVSSLKFLKLKPPAPGSNEHCLLESQTAISVESGAKKKKKATQKKSCQKLQQESCESGEEV